MYRIVRELVHNAYRHSQTSEAQLAIRLQANSILIRVTDSGVGFDDRSEPVTRGSPFGLANLRQRIRATGGRLTLESMPGRGCRVSVELPLLPQTDARNARPAASEPA
jgi:signal transduction histidine kinase